MKTRGGGKAKGADYERLICKRLSLWMSRGMREDLFWRSAMSGGRATVAHKMGRSVSQGGDITAVDTRGAPLTDNVLIECKHYAEINLRTLMVEGNHGNISEWWMQARRDAERQSLFPLLIAKCRTGEYAIIDDQGLVFFNLVRQEAHACFPRHNAWLFHLTWFLLNAKRPR